MSVSKSNKEKRLKLKLFGVELDPSQLYEEEGSDESMSSSSLSSPVTEKPAKKFACSCCLKVFANPQALGGHQKAHKNEKMRQKKLQLQARKASCLSYYINPSFNKFCDINSENLVNFSGSNPHWFHDLNKEVRISFGSESDSIHSDTNNHQFSVTDGSRMKSRLIHGRSPQSKRVCIRKGLDLHLGLGL